MLETNKIYFGDCLEIMKEIDDASIDMVLCDLPYGRVSSTCKWDTVINFDLLWQQYKRVIKENGAIILTSAQPFTSALVSSNYEMFKYEWIWEKSKATGYLNSKHMPMIAHENILVFGKGKLKYNPQKTEGKKYNKGKAHRPTDVYGEQVAVLVKNDDGTRYPRTVQYFVTAEAEGKLHPTQKPLALFEYFIRTYTNEGDLVLDNCIGSGTTAVAALKTSRRYLGIEKDLIYYETANKRVSDYLAAQI